MTQAINLDEIDLKANLGQFSTFDMEIAVPEIQKLRQGDFYLEVGVDRGKSLSVAKMVAEKGVQIYGVDLLPSPKVPGTHFIQGNSQDIAKNWTRKIGVLFIDGDHTYEGCKADIDSWYPHMKTHGVMLFHDCDDGGPGIQRAVREFAETNGYDVFYSPNQRCSMARIRL